MKNWVKRMIDQHGQTIVEIDKAEAFLKNAINDEKTPKSTIANMSLIVRDLKNLAKDYQVMLSNEGIEFTPNGEYFEKIAHINK